MTNIFCSTFYKVVKQYEGSEKEIIDWQRRLLGDGKPIDDTPELPGIIAADLTKVVKRHQQESTPTEKDEYLATLALLAAINHDRRKAPQRSAAAVGWQ